MHRQILICVTELAILHSIPPERMECKSSKSVIHQSKCLFQENKNWASTIRVGQAITCVMEQVNITVTVFGNYHTAQAINVREQDRKNM